MALREPQGRGWALKGEGVREENILVRKLCRYKGSSTRELLKRVKH